MRILVLLAFIAVVPYLALAEAPARDVTELDAAQVAAAFAKGAPLLENDLYKIHASRREAAGVAEVHERDTDIIYVLDGEARFVTGGRVVAGQEIGPDEIRGPRIEGGTARALSKGEVVVVPNGTPHWFESVPGPFVYYVVKVTSEE
jgi:glc operon protein GlcG